MIAGSCAFGVATCFFVLFVMDNGARGCYDNVLVVTNRPAICRTDG